MPLPLFGWLVIICIAQQFMILAEKRICREKYGADAAYLHQVPRYFCRR